MNTTTTTTTTDGSVTFSAPDLTLRPPRSLRVRLGGYAILPRILDKCRAHIAGTPGDYHFNCPLDRQFFAFTGIDAAEFRSELARRRTDSEMLRWVEDHVNPVRAPWEIEAWSTYQDRRPPASDPDTLEFFAKTLGNISRTRTDVHAWADLLDLDDPVSYGGSH